MNVTELIALCQSKGISIRLDDGNLKIAGKAERLDKATLSLLKDNKAALVDYLGQVQPSESMAYPVTASPSEGIYTRSLNQSAMYFLHQFDKGHAAGNLPSIYLIRGEVDRSALAVAFSQLIERHEVLRTCYGEDVASTKILATSSFELQLDDLSAQDLDEEQLNASVEELVCREANTLFDLEHGEVIKARLIRTKPLEYLLLLTLHHIAADGWSWQIITDELSELYRSAKENRPSHLPALPLQYSDFATSQRQWLNDGGAEPSLAYWQQQMEGAPALHGVPTDFPRPAQLQYSGRSFVAKIEASQRQQLKAMQRDTGTTLFVLLQSLLSVLVARYSGEHEHVIGTPVHGRHHADLESLCGYFVNMLPLRVEIGDGMSFLELVERNAKCVNEMLEHQLVPFEMIVNTLAPERSISHNSLFQIVFSLHNQIDDLQLEGASVERQLPSVLPSRFDLNLHAVDDGHQIQLLWEYNTALFGEETIRQLSTHYIRLLDAALAAPRAEIDTLPMLSESELSSLPGLSEQTYAVSRCLHQAVRQYADVTPQSTAITVEGRHYSYGYLNRKADVLAATLLEAGVTRNSIVGLCVERSVEMLIGVVAILKSGGAYLPLDPAYPKERLDYVIGDACPVVVIKQAGLAVDMAVYSGPVIELEAERLADHAASVEVASNPDDLAYVIYTSGSTGRPKGVKVSHANVLRLFSSAEQHFSFGPDDVWTLFHSFAFDFSVWEIWGAFLYGGRLVIVSQETSRSPDRFVQLLADERITVLNQTPSAFYPLSERLVAGGSPLALRYVVFGGEALELPKLQPWFHRFGENSPVMVNMYGITETTVHVTYCKLDPAMASANASVIGVPLSDLQVYVCNPKMQRQPFRVAGEMYVGGAGVTLGYLGRPELNAERFIDNPFGPGKLYRTGDLACWLPDGRLEYLGRIDHQVKIRGFRIELGEIESRLNRHPDVAQATVLVSEEDGHKLLLSWVQATAGNVEIEELRRYLAEFLPAHMVPHHIFIVEAMPLTVNGKVDRNRLLAMDRIEVERNYVAPSTEPQRVLVEIWQQVLGLAKVGITDRFFAIGGDSILSLRVVSSLREKGYHCTVSNIFTADTIERLASVLVPLDSTESNSYSVYSLLPAGEGSRLAAAIAADGIVDAYPASAMQNGMVYHSYLEPDSDIYHDVLSFNVSLPWDEECFNAALKTMVSRHEILRTGFYLDPVEGSLIQVVYEAAEPPVSVFDLRSCPQHEHREIIEESIREERRTPFDLQGRSLVRLFVHLLEREQLVLTLSCSHAVLDGWSVSRFNTELLQVYIALLNGGLHQFEELPAPYHRFIEQEITCRRDEGAKQFWNDKLSGATVTSLPLFEAASASDERDSFYSHKLDGLKDRLVELAESLDVPFQHVLLAGHFKVLSLMSGDTDVLSCVVSNGRPALAGGDVTLGLFLNTLPLRHQLTQSSWSELIKTVSRVATESIAHRMYPISDIQQQTSLDFDKVLFNYTHFHSYGALEAEGIAFEPYAKYEASTFAFVAQFIQMPSAFLLELQYPKHGDNAPIVRQLEACYQQVFSSMAEQPEQSHCGIFDTRNDDLPHNLLDHTDSTSSGSELLPVHRMFEQQVSVSPDSTALVFDGTGISYQELNARANRLARYLAEQGIGSESLVGILLERSIDMVVSLLAVLKAGAAYVPLDPAFPAGRITSVLADAGCAAVICSSDTAGLVSGMDMPKIKPAEIWPRLESGYSLENIDIPVEDSSLAYVIYTSGSTGRPKGVQIEHRAISNFIAAVRARYATDEQAHTLALTTVSFDIAALELYLPLVSGAICVLGSREDALSGSRVQALVDRYGIRVIQATPSGYQLLLEGGEWRGSDKLQLLCGGEALSVPLAKQLLTKGKKLWNQYGPTEATVWVTACEVTRGELEAGEGYVAIGGWLDNCAGVILNELGECVPQGVPGELYLSGACLARGYINRDELTSACFIRHSLGGAPEQRLYKTGDKVRLSETGRIEYLSRLDHQVKIRGHRIELGEIEAVLNQHAGVKESTVITDERRDSKQLLAYVVPSDHTTVADKGLVGGLHSHLKAKLPEYMIPAAVTVLASMPLTPNGKVDRKALPAPELAGSREGTPLATPTEHQLAAIWQSVLELNEQPWANSDFFALGGHSLLAVKMAVKVRARFGCELPLKVVLAERKLAQLAEFIDNAAAATSRPALVRRAVPSRRLPTYAQQRMWFIEQVPNGAGLYNMPMVVNLQGELDIARLSRVIERRVLRFEALRTVFDDSGDELEMKLLPGNSFALTVTDLSGLSEAEKYRAVRALAEQNAKMPFDLSRDVLLRGELVVLAEQQYQLLLTMHHIASDGWSWGVFIDEINRDYNHRDAGGPELPALPIEVADFAEVQRQWLASEKATLLEYWQHQLADLPVLHSMPADFKRPMVQDYRGCHHHFKIAPALTARLKACCERQNVTLFVLLQTVFSVLLSRYSGESDIVMGTPVAGREYEELENQVGLFVNTVVLRNEVSGNSTFAQQLQLASQMISAALEHQDVPFEWLVDGLSPERSTAHTPLFQVLFAMQNVKQPALALANITAEMVIPQETVSRFDLSLYCSEEEQGIGCFFEYAQALFRPETIVRMSRHFENLLVDVVGSMEKKVSELAMLDDRQRRFMLEEWNQTGREYRKDRLIHQWIEHQVSLTPNAIALVFEEQVLSYAELNERANQLAHYLLQHVHSTGPDTLVGVCMERSLEMVISLVAILKAGMAYVPFDPGYPPARLDYMLQDSGVDIVLLQEGLLAPSENRTDVVVDYQFVTAGLAHYPATNPSPEVGLSDLAYMIYTSGSTGKPKGVMVGHGAILNRLQWMQEAFGLTDRDKVLQKTPFSFDVSVWEFFWPLMYGAQLVVAKPGGHKNSAYLAELIAEQGITTLHFVPSMLQLFVEEPALAQCDRLRYVFCSGEALPYDLQQRFFDMHPTAELHNLYGPTEAAVDVTWWPCQRGCDSGRVPIGRPIANIQTLVLDQQLQPVPVGVPGELYLGGEGLARGYRNKPELTGRSFIPHPFAPGTSQRLYKTGDKVRWLPDGSIEYLGRLDHQIKLRGFRIELGEIESALLEQDAVREAIVMVNQDRGTPLLVAYVVLNTAGQVQGGLSAGALRKYLKANLPEYLVPAQIIAVDQMPLTPNGKLDRKALPAPDFLEEGVFVAPKTEVEQSLSDIWHELLSVRCSTDKRFFDVGGHSLLAIKVISLVKKHYPQVNVTVQTMFERQTIELLAEEIEQQLNIIENQTSYQNLAEVAEVSEVEF